MITDPTNTVFYLLWLDSTEGATDPSPLADNTFLVVTAVVIVVCSLVLYWFSSKK